MGLKLKNSDINLRDGVKTLKQFLNETLHVGNKENQQKTKRLEIERELIENIDTAKKEWLIAKKNFELANNDEVVDYYIYKIKAYEVKYESLLKQAKRQGIKVNLLKDY